ncbi:MAG: hypothetical protein U9N73_02310 [Candidatus Auribacterota bacterium]|nr:hypothetical protein [Candidatus Auribacterota bacterium]
MRYQYLVPISALIILLSSCATPPKPVSYDVQVHTVDNQQINLCNFKVMEKSYHIESDAFRARWRQSLELVTLPFDDIVSAQKVGRFITRVRFKDGSEDDFTEFFIDKYNMKGWSDYGPFEINATLVRGLVFVDAEGSPVGGEVAGIIPPIISPPETEDRFITFDGDIISGELQDKQFKIRSAYGTLILSGDLIREILIDREAEVLQQIVKLKNGDIISGFLEPPRVKMIISGDQVVSLDVDQLSRVRFGRPVASEEDEER